jgi:hypothetical protein
MAPEPTMQPSPDKGKARAIPSDEPTENTPLLGAPSASQSSVYNGSLVPPTDSSTPRLSLRKKLAFVFFYTLAICIGIFIILGCLAWSYAAKVSNIDPDDVIRNALVYDEVKRIDVLDFSQGGRIRVKLEGRLGIDAGSIVDVNSDPEEDGVFQSLWKALGRWGIEKMEEVTVIIPGITIRSASNPFVVLAYVEAQPITLPLTVNPPPDLSWLTDIKTEVLVTPNDDPQALLDFAKQSWKKGSVDSRVHMDSVTVQGGTLKERGWRRRLDKRFSNIDIVIRIPRKYRDF